MKCISGAVNGASVEDFGKVTVVIFKKTHYNRECPNQIGHSFLCDRKFLSHKMLREDSLRIALRRLGSMSQKRPAAGGESCEQDSFS